MADDVKECPNCEQPALVEGLCSECGWTEGDDRSSSGAGELPEGAVFDPRTGSYVFRKRWTDVYGMSALGAAALFLWFLVPELLAEIDQGSVSLLLPPALLFFVYLAAVPLVNRTELRVSQERLEVRCGPLRVPLVSNLSVGPQEVKRIWVHRESSAGSNSFGAKYQLMVETASGGETVLTFPERKRAVASQLQKLISRTLGLPR